MARPAANIWISGSAIARECLCPQQQMAWKRSSKSFWSRATSALTGWIGTWWNWSVIRHPARCWNAAFRALHTLKGNSAALIFPRLESLAHAGENLLCRLRDGKLQLHPALTGALLAMTDAMRARLNAIQRDGYEDTGDFSCVLRSTGSCVPRRPSA